jgi:hypothetical protein
MSNNIMKIVQVGILILLIVVAGLLYGIWMQKSPPSPVVSTPPSVETAANPPQAASKEVVLPPTPTPAEAVKSETIAPPSSSPEKKTAPAKPAQKKQKEMKFLPREEKSPNPTAASTHADIEPPAPLPQIPVPPPADTSNNQAVAEPPKDSPPPKMTVTIPAGTKLPVRLMESLSTARNQVGDRFSAVLDDALIFNGILIADKGANLSGRVLQCARSGRVKGLAEMVLDLNRLTTISGEVDILTDSLNQEAKDTKKEDATKVGIATAIGAAIGAIAGGGKGAAIGAGAGAGAGAGTVMATRGKEVELERESQLTFALRDAVNVVVESQPGSSDSKGRRKLSNRF